MINTALLLEDIPDTQVFMDGVIQTAFPNIQVHVESRVAGALKRCSEFHFDVAVIDLSLPDGDGTTVIEAISARSPDCIIIVASIFDDDDHIFPALRAGAHGYLLKDQPVNLLVNQLRGIIEGQPPLSPAIARRLLGHFRAKINPVTSDTSLSEIALSVREREVLGQLALGHNIDDIGTLMNISRHTVHDHVKNIYRKLNISSRAEAAIRAKRMGLL